MGGLSGSVCMLPHLGMPQGGTAVLKSRGIAEISLYRCGGGDKNQVANDVSCLHMDNAMDQRVDLQFSINIE